LLAEDLRAFLEEHWVLHSTLIGHSMGGKVAMQLALDHPDMVDRLVVVDIAPGQATDNHASIFQALLGLDLSALTERTQAEAYLAQRIPDFGTRQFLLKNITRHHDGSFAWKMNLPALWKHYPDILAPVVGSPYTKPTLFIRGEHSDYVPDSALPLIRSLFPQAEVLTIPDAGHWVHADQPAALLAALQDWLA
ncbi:MAG TPA: alpha/beta fold hydrolase, partial [Saprospiraceae bacterium]|nr:alpha/beta fold hydrolase [Saprospiraceae bacterium]